MTIPILITTTTLPFSSSSSPYHRHHHHQLISLPIYPYLYLLPDLRIRIRREANAAQRNLLRGRFRRPRPGVPPRHQRRQLHHIGPRPRSTQRHRDRRDELRQQDQHVDHKRAAGGGRSLILHTIYAYIPVYLSIYMYIYYTHAHTHTHAYK